MTSSIMAPPLLDVRDLRTEFTRGKRKVLAVDGVSFSLGVGEVLGVVGESGSGKSVTMLSLMGLERPTGGSVRFDGEELLDLDEAGMRRIRGNRIGMIFQDPMKSLNPVLTVGRQLMEPLRVHRQLDRRAARKRAVELLAMVGIPGAALRVDDYPHQFSGGMRQRVMIAMALSCEPAVLIADEPTTALDVTVQAQILELIGSMQRELGMAVIIVSHDLGVVAGMADRICVMYGGRVVESGRVEDVYALPSHPYTRGLLGSIPRVEVERGSRLEAIPGSPPDLTRLPSGCAFRDRCRFATGTCALEAPPLVDVPGGGGGHSAACVLDVTPEAWRARTTTAEVA
ncbi:ABC transporter ATP-binding protein [Pseudonocardia sulfidoxydans NBRC 16205]|uniref:ABC transporter ATP-binding protein n=1 Tax=Pseudonocardia sulfidoxydans NBRC 16205 TaxID=1223511 RepID=A0A511DP21_9PSEU|nr:ABC transporter ATP-binding protein [Pseudonocardia sulfidoxydans]GEL26545.1 ABC transporter ATP-binding protein [Pseudonocardia sulfidoxydans NBRC 16205]